MSFTSEMSSGLKSIKKMSNDKFSRKYKSAIDIYNHIFYEWIPTVRFKDRTGDVSLENSIVPSRGVLSSHDLYGMIIPMKREIFVEWGGHQYIKTNFIRMVINTSELSLKFKSGFFHKDPKIKTRFSLGRVTSKRRFERFIFMDIFPSLNLIRIYTDFEEVAKSMEFRDYRSFKSFLDTGFFLYLSYAYSIRYDSDDGSFGHLKVL